jgi:GNAT superfamily N-acetyltransferase
VSAASRDLDLTGYVERGYTSVRPEYRGLGIGTSLLEGLTRNGPATAKIFSVIAEDNEATKIIAMRNRYPPRWPPISAKKPARRWVSGCRNG